MSNNRITIRPVVGYKNKTVAWQARCVDPKGVPWTIELSRLEALQNTLADRFPGYTMSILKRAIYR